MLLWNLESSVKRDKLIKNILTIWDKLFRNRDIHSSHIQTAVSAELELGLEGRWQIRKFAFCLKKREEDKGSAMSWRYKWPEKMRSLSLQGDIQRDFYIQYRQWFDLMILFIFLLFTMVWELNTFSTNCTSNFEFFFTVLTIWQTVLLVLSICREPQLPVIHRITGINR